MKKAISDEPKKPKILFFDIETQANLAYVWGKYEQNVISYKRHWYMISFAYKWLDDKVVRAKCLADYKGYKSDMYNDELLIKDLWKLFDEADVIVGHNSRRFDISKSNARFIKHKLPPPSPYKIVDTKEVAKRYFKMDSNKLDDICDYFGIGRKINTGGFGLWLGCEAGDMDSWNKMVKYNKYDVVLLEKAYFAMLPFMNNHPNIALLSGNKDCCPNCGSNDIQHRGYAYTRTTKSRRFQCNKCHAWSQAPIKMGSQIR